MYVKDGTSVLKRVLMSKSTYLEAAPINEIAKKWSSKPLDRDLLKREHESIVAAYHKYGVEVVLLDADPQRPNSVFSRDFGGCVREGYILGNFKEPIRFKERADYEKKMAELGIPKIAEVKAGLFEGGDFAFIDRNTIAIGTAVRSDLAGIREIQAALAPYGYTIIPVAMDEKYLHLDLCFNLVADDLAIVCSKALPEYFLNILYTKGIETIDITEEQVFQHGCNVEAIGDRRVVSLNQNHFVNEKLREKGCTVIELDIVEHLKAGGGPHCMTFPLERN